MSQTWVEQIGPMRDNGTCPSCGHPGAWVRKFVEGYEMNVLRYFMVTTCPVCEYEFDEPCAVTLTANLDG